MDPEENLPFLMQEQMYVIMPPYSFSGTTLLMLISLQRQLNMQSSIV